MKLAVNWNDGESYYWIGSYELDVVDSIVEYKMYIHIFQKR